MLANKDKGTSVGFSKFEIESERIEYVKESTWFDNYYAYWIRELHYDGKHWEPITKTIAMALSLKSKEDASEIADKIISLLKQSQP